MTDRQVIEFRRSPAALNAEIESVLNIRGPLTVREIVRRVYDGDHDNAQRYELRYRQVHRALLKLRSDCVVRRRCSCGVNHWRLSE